MNNMSPTFLQHKGHCGIAESGRRRQLWNFPSAVPLHPDFSVVIAQSSPIKEPQLSLIQATLWHVVERAAIAL